MAQLVISNLTIRSDWHDPNADPETEAKALIEAINVVIGPRIDTQPQVYHYIQEENCVEIESDDDDEQQD